MAVAFDWAVYDGGNNADGLTWATAYQSIITALAAVSAGETIAIASDHSEPALGSSIAANGIGTSASPLLVVSLDRTDDSYENMVTGGGRIVQTGTTDFSFGEWTIWMGIDILVADNFQMNQVGAAQIIDSKIEVNDHFSVGNATHENTITFENVDYVQGTAGIFLLLAGGATFYWRGGSFTFSAGSITYLVGTTPEGCNVVIEDVDLSAIGAGDYLVEGTGFKSDILFKRCKLSANLAGFITGTIDNEGFIAKFHSCSSADIVYQFHEASFYGTVDDDTANYLNATADGSTGYSAKMVTNASPLEFYKPLKFKLADIWVAANQTLTVETITSNVTLQNDEFWIEVEYPDATTKAQGNVLSSKLGATGEGDWTGDPGATPANLTASVAGWTEVLANEVKQKIALTISGGGEGVHTVWACLAKPSTTVYVDPKITVS